MQIARSAATGAHATGALETASASSTFMAPPASTLAALLEMEKSSVQGTVHVSPCAVRVTAARERVIENMAVPELRRDVHEL